MARDDVQHTTLTNGLTVVVETMPAVRSAAFTMLIPAGSMFDVRGQNGTATALADWITRGAGDRSSREVLAELDRLGIQSRESASAQHLVISGTCLAEKMSAALQIYADVILHPTLDDSDFGAVMSGLENGLLSIEDDPQKKAMVELVRRCYPLPLGQPAEGTLADLENLNPEIVRGHYQKNVRPNGAILGIAGNVTLDDLLPILENSFEAWRGGDGITLREGQSGPRREHLFHESIQTHIGVAYPAVAYSHPDYYSAWAAVSVLSGGMSSRLFTEVREKRGLCYSVYAALNTLRDRGQVLCYAGTTTERAQETLDVLCRELVRLGDGISEEELGRCKARAKSSLVMAQESTGSRASSLARDWYHLRRIVSLDEVRSKIEGLSVQAVLEYVHSHPAKDFTILSIGPQELN